MNEKQLTEMQDNALAIPALIDINTADVETLSQLPRIGSVVAGRIVEYRLRQPFRRPEDLMNVPGIGAATYRDLADRITVAVEPPAAPADVELAPATPPDSPEPETTAEPVVELPPYSAEAMPLPTLAPMPAEAPQPAPALVGPAPATPPEAPEPEAIAEPAAELSLPDTESPPAGPMPLPAPEPSPAKAPQPAPVSRPEELPIASPPAARPAQAPTRDWNGLIGMSLLGALLGMIFTLLLLAGINRGTLILNQQDEVTVLSAQADDLSTRVTGLESTAKSLRARLDELEGLTGRVDEMEAALGEIGSDLDAFETEVGSLNERADVLAAEVETFRAAADRFDAFLKGLRDLLAEFPESPSPTASPDGSATSTPAP